MTSRRISVIALLLFSSILLAGCCLPATCKSGCGTAMGQSSCPHAESCAEAAVNKPCCAKMTGAGPAAQ